MIGLSYSRALLIFSGFTLLAACSGPRVMMPTPNVQVNADNSVYENLHEDLKTTEVPIFYITDRSPERDENGNLKYGYGRSNSLAFGTAIVDMGIDISWEQLLEASRAQKRIKDVKMTVTDIHEIVRGPNSPIPFLEIDGKVVEDPDFVVVRDAAAEVLRREIVNYLTLTPRKEIFIFIHGFRSDFDDAAFTMAELWHFLGRVGVPIVYSWPAGHPGLFGYTYDRESSEFTVYHLRQTIQFMAGFPEVEEINIIAHSRGTDVAVTALRELTIAARAVGEQPREKFKINNFVLAAPDLDAQVAAHRIIGDFLSLSANRFTIYASPADRAIGWSDKLFDSPRGRVGNLRLSDLSEETRAAMEKGSASFSIISFPSYSDKSDSNADSLGHSYFRNAPAVSSDLILMLRDDLDPGTEGRPLEHLGLKFWRVPPGYPATRP